MMYVFCLYVVRPSAALVGMMRLVFYGGNNSVSGCSHVKEKGTHGSGDGIPQPAPTLCT